MEARKKPKAVVVGGSIAGVSTAHALISAGWDVVVLEKSSSASSGIPTGAGLGLDPLSCSILQSWLPQQPLHCNTLPLPIEQNRLICEEEVDAGMVLTRDENFNFKAAHWYAGYCAWRGVFDFSGRENSEAILGIRESYPDLGKCLYFDLGQKMHIVIYELMNKRMNWIWYVNIPEPELNGNSVTMKVSREMTEAMHKEAEKVWNIDLGRLIGETKDPFLNVIYDADPLERLYWGNVVLVGDAAHPTTPHCLRSTNMSILDAAVLGKCLRKWGAEMLQSALEEYQATRLPVVSTQALHSRKVGRIKQGLPVDGFPEPFCLKELSEDCRELLQQKNVPFFAHVPPLLQESYDNDLKCLAS